MWDSQLEIQLSHGGEAVNCGTGHTYNFYGPSRRVVILHQPSTSGDSTRFVEFRPKEKHVKSREIPRRLGRYETRLFMSQRAGNAVETMRIPYARGQLQE